MLLRESSGWTGRKAAFGGILSALVLCVLYVGCVLPTNRFSLLALSSLLISAAVIEYGPAYSFLVYGTVSLLGLIFLPNKFLAALFFVFFGHYGILKHLIERRSGFWLEWLLKIGVFNGAVLGLWWGGTRLFSLSFPESPSVLWGIWILGNGVFVIFDYAYSQAVGFYERRLRPKFWRK